MLRNRDLTVAGILTVVSLLSLRGIDSVSTVDRPVDVGAVALVLLACAALVFRTSHPLPVLVVVAAATSAYLLLTYPYGTILFALALAVWTTAHRCPPTVSGVAAVGAFGGLLLHLPRHPGALGGAVGVLPTLAWVAIPYTAGVARRMVREARERERAEADRRLIASERLRLAQEVHDVVGHALAAIQMQADISLHVSGGATGGAASQAALSTISRASREALEELRWTLATTHPRAGDADRSPIPGLARLDPLIAGVEAAGIHIDLGIRGHRRDLAPRVDLAAYRVIQESLTNIVKHSSHPRARITLSYGSDILSIQVSNDDLAVEPDAPGLGTTGMRSRVEQLGGTFSAGHDATGRRYVVHAELPIDGSKGIG